MGLGRHRIKLLIGVFLGIFFMFLAVRRIDLVQTWEAFKTANYLYLLPTLAVVFLSHYLRALRWRYLLDPIKRLDVGSLFSSLMIGYMANLLIPAHLGEILRAYVLSKKRSISVSSTFATVVIERIIDIFTLLALMVFSIFIYQFPPWVKTSGYIMLAGTLCLFAFLILLKNFPSHVHAILDLAMKPLPTRFQQRTWDIIERFVAGIVPLRRRRDYSIVAVLSVLIWACYGLAFYLTLHAFNFFGTFQLPWSASIVLLVITTISVVIPSSPGYVGTYHFLCQVSLAIFGVPAGPAVSFAVVIHGINFLPILLVGLILSYYEGVGISRLEERTSMIQAQRPLARRNAA